MIARMHAWIAHAQGWWRLWQWRRQRGWWEVTQLGWQDDEPVCGVRWAQPFEGAYFHLDAPASGFQAAISLAQELNWRTVKPWHVAPTQVRAGVQLTETRA